MPSRVGAGSFLQDVAGSRRMLFGAAVSAAHLRDAALCEAILRETGSLTAELEMKWSHVERHEGQFEFQDADAVANFAHAHQKRLHGHALLWHRSIPDWAMKAGRLQDDWDSIERFVAAMARRYSGVESWDVINEPIGPAEQPDGLRQSAFLHAFGPDYIRRALVSARRHAPRAVLCINEYGIEYNTPEHERKRRGLVQLLAELRRDGIPLDCVGVQAHLDLSQHHHFDPAVFARFLDELGAMGLQVRISELDVKEKDSDGSVAERDRAVAEATRSFLSVALQNRAVGSITCWGLSDRYSWLDVPAGNRGLPFDTDMRRKPMHSAILDALSQRQA
ncbi:endo-1,4-beta-xylanase [Novosphingobium sp. PS1R-30]|uniref:Beta-xylanase n=1 Tax=Novosphingobium anseongense TaxID=3133436 RepID=A0ABU8RUN3_9SPHN